MLPINKTLYQKNSLGKLQEWNIIVEGSTIIKTWGELGGKMIVRKNTIKTGKNIGKSNETTTEGQARLEAIADIEKKVKREGYFSIGDLGFTLEPFTEFGENVYSNKKLDQFNRTLSEVLKLLPKTGITEEGTALPMLAKNYYKDNGQPSIKFPCLAQPKFNGVRATGRFMGESFVLKSRTNLVYNMPEVSTVMIHYREMMEQFCLQQEVLIEDLVFDGELYIHNTILADIVSAVKKPNLNTHRIQYWVYDLAIEDVKQVDRLKLLKDILATMSFHSHIVKMAPTVITNNAENAELRIDRFIEQGYEGAIFRNPNGFYKFGVRSGDMVKAKRRMSEEFEIIDVFDTDKQPGLAMFRCRNNINNCYFNVTPEGNHELRKKYLNERSKLLGKVLTVEFYERTDAPDSLPFHAVGICVRNYE